MAASSGATQRVWVKVKGGASCIRVATEGLLDVAMLIEKVKEEVNPLLDNVPLPNINLYRSEQVKNDGGEAPTQFLSLSCVVLPSAVTRASQNVVFVACCSELRVKVSRLHGIVDFVLVSRSVLRMLS